MPYGTDPCRMEKPKKRYVLVALAQLPNSTFLFEANNLLTTIRVAQLRHREGALLTLGCFQARWNHGSTQALSIAQ